MGAGRGGEVVVKVWIWGGRVDRWVHYLRHYNRYDTCSSFPSPDWQMGLYLRDRRGVLFQHFLLQPYYVGYNTGTCGPSMGAVGDYVGGEIPVHYCYCCVVVAYLVCVFDAYLVNKFDSAKYSFKFRLI